VILAQCFDSFWKEKIGLVKIFSLRKKLNSLETFGYVG